MSHANIFHDGEVFVQERVGERATAIINARNLSTAIPAAAKMFVGQQIWCVLSATDTFGRVWSSLIIGDKGFLEVDDDSRGVTIKSSSLKSDLIAVRPITELTVGQSVGMLMIETTTRRRLRVNGVVTWFNETGMHLSVEEAFPACPKYIQRREADLTETDASVESIGSVISAHEELEKILAYTDTLFLGSIGPNARMDVSHRGGNTGFAKIKDGSIWMPDFKGNSLFNTLGNLHLDSRCGMVIPDFQTGRQIQLTGRAKGHFEVSEGAELTGGSQRWIEFQMDTDGFSVAPLPANWKFVDFSPFNP